MILGTASDAGKSLRIGAAVWTLIEVDDDRSSIGRKKPYEVFPDNFRGNICMDIIYAEQDAQR